MLSRITHQSELARQQSAGVSANAVLGKHKSERQFSVRRLSTASVSDVDLEKLSGLIVASYKTRSQLPPGDILFSLLSAKVREASDRLCNPPYAHTKDSCCLCAHLMRVLT